LPRPAFLEHREQHPPDQSVECAFVGAIVADRRKQGVERRRAGRDRGRANGSAERCHRVAE